MELGYTVSPRHAIRRKNIRKGGFSLGRKIAHLIITGFLLFSSYVVWDYIKNPPKEDTIKKESAQDEKKQYFKDTPKNTIESKTENFMAKHPEYKSMDFKEIAQSLEAKINDNYPDDPKVAGWWSIRTIEEIIRRYDGYKDVVLEKLEPHREHIPFENLEKYFMAILGSESSMGIKKLSDAGAAGDTGVMPDTADTINDLCLCYGVESIFNCYNDLFDKEKNIEGSIVYTRYLAERFGNDPLLVAAAYNGGPEYIQGLLEKHRDVYKEYGVTCIEDGIEKGLAQFMYTETKNYVGKVKSFMEDFENYESLQLIKKNYPDYFLSVDGKDYNVSFDTKSSPINKKLQKAA